MEHDTRHEKRERATKFLAILGFISIVVLLAWITFAMIGSIPNLLSTVREAPSTDEPITFTTTPLLDSIRHSETVTLEWDRVDARGTYALEIDCVDGVQAVVRTEEYGTQTINCGTFYNIGDITSVMMTLESTEYESIDLLYTIAFIPDERPHEQYESSAVVTITNPALAIRDDEEDEEEDVPVTEPEDEVDSEPHTPSAPSTPVTTYPRYEYVYQIPVSDPSGYTDLRLGLSSFGVLDSAQRFTPRGTLPTGTMGALRFTVKNTGTRTSERWTYTATLPSGRTYESPSQSPLRPNETATITIGFRTPSETGRHDVAVAIDTTRDRDRSNHSFSWMVNVTN